MDANLFEVVQGSAWVSPRLVLHDGDGLAMNLDAGTTSTCIAWTGDARATAFDVSAVYAANTGQLQLSLAADVTAAVTPGLYRLELAVTPPGQNTTRRPIGFLRLLASPGVGDTATVLAKTYCSFDDVILYAPWIMDLITADPSMQSDLAEQRSRARTWLEEIILNRDRPDPAFSSGFSPSDSHFSPRWGMTRYGWVGPNPWLRDRLNNDKLIIRAWVIEATARKAISLTCEPQLGKTNGQDGTPYSALAVRYAAQASGLVQASVAEVNTSDNQSNDQIYVAGYRVPLSLCSSR